MVGDFCSDRNAEKKRTVRCFTLCFHCSYFCCYSSPAAVLTAPTAATTAAAAATAAHATCAATAADVAVTARATAAAVTFFTYSSLTDSDEGPKMLMQTGRGRTSPRYTLQGKTPRCSARSAGSGMEG